MAEKISLYISAAADLEIERESLTRSVAEIPLDIGWQIGVSPLRDEPPNLAAVAQADVHFLILGSDIRAPLGVELLTARRAGRFPTFFLKDLTQRTLAAQDFVRYIAEQATWRLYQNYSDLRQQALSLLVEMLLERARFFSLSQVEIDKLDHFRNDLAESKEKRVEDAFGGTGESSIILTVKRYVPSQGILIKPDGTVGGEEKGR